MFIFEVLFLFFGILTICRNIYVMFSLFGLTNLFPSIKNYYLYSLLVPVFLIFFTFQLHFPLNYFVFTGLCLSSFLLKPLTESYLEQKMRTYFSHILNILVLKMKAGHSFLSALKSTSRECDPLIQKKMSNILSLLEYSNEKQIRALKGFDLEIVLRLQEIMQSSSHRLRQICQLRNELNMRNEFVNKSRQAAFQTRLQSFLLIGIYAFTAIFMAKVYGFDAIKLWLGFSLPLLIIGTYLLLNIPKQFKWRI